MGTKEAMKNSGGEVRERFDLSFSLPKNAVESQSTVCRNN
jgi:hypothetical protein